MRHSPAVLVAATATAALLALVNAGALGAEAGPPTRTGQTALLGSGRHATRPAKATQKAVFKAGVDVVEVAATVTDDDGRVVRGLTKEDFIVYDDGRRQEIVAFTSERVPVSLAMLLDVSASMTDEQLATARLAINHFVFGLLDKEDELFLMEFAGRGRILQPWTRDREMFSSALGRARALTLEPTVALHPDETLLPQNYGTAIYDAVATSLGFAAKGAHRKQAVLVISDGKDTSSRRTVKQVQEAIRASELLVYALGVDGGASASVDTGALRKLTDETGGRTEVVKGFDKLDIATARLADEFNQQYMIGYAASSIRDGRWHTIRVEVRTRGSQVRARAGYVAF